LDVIEAIMREIVDELRRRNVALNANVVRACLTDVLIVAAASLHVSTIEDAIKASLDAC
jgi:hypothetical protein